MQRDFHYNAIKTLAQLAGIDAEEAEIIAYASEYVDDAIYHSEINLEFTSELNFERIADKTFNPICTAHRGIQRVKAINHDVQLKVYVAFHFIPDIKNDEVYYITQPNNELSKLLINNALDELNNSTGELRIQKLIKLGIAIHSFSDTWAHQNFSGRYCHDENDIKDIEIMKGSDWIPISSWESLQSMAMPDIGHAEAKNLPDLSHLKWRYTKVANENLIIRDNTLIFMQASNEIFNIFKKISNSDEDWSFHDFRFLQCFNKKTENLDEKIVNFKNKFPEIDFIYDENRWMNSALENKDKKWFYFHIEALNQRKYILEKIKSDTI